MYILETMVKPNKVTIILGAKLTFNQTNNSLINIDKYFNFLVYATAYIPRARGACAITYQGTDYISGFKKDSVHPDACKAECTKHWWCKGVRSGINKFYDPGRPLDCRLLTNFRIAFPGWNLVNSGHWVEPSEWKDGSLETVNSGYSCYEKIETGIYVTRNIAPNSLHCKE